MKKVLMPVGTDNFEEIRNHGYYYVDKTGLIGKLFDSPAKVHLFTRPRRFGKSLNISMLQSFFEIGGDPKLFEGLKITENRELCEKHQNRYPVISLSLKGAEGKTFEHALQCIASAVAVESMRVRDLLDLKSVRAEDISRLNAICADGASQVQIEGSLILMTRLLREQYGRSAILLIDEYDVPLQKAYYRDYYDDMVLFVRNFLGNAVKTNANLAFAVMTGCLKISNESIFTGLNNVYVYSITDPTFDEYFGFTEKEVMTILKDTGHPEAYAKAKEWYDGYRFGNSDIYCPFDVVNYCKGMADTGSIEPKVYWINSSGNDIIRDFLKTATQEMREDFQTLRNGGSIHKAINEHITYRDMDKRPENLWSVMYMTGYLTQDRKQPKDENGLFDLVIPNKEVKQIYDNSFALWLEQDVIKAYSSELSELLWNCDAEGFKKILQSVLMRTISFFDSQESYFHGLLAGLLSAPDYDVKSNRENGLGRSDITIEDTGRALAAIIEVKHSESVKQLQGDSEKGLQQIKDKEYMNDFIYHGDKIILCRIAFFDKYCHVTMEKYS